MASPSYSAFAASTDDLAMFLLSPPLAPLEFATPPLSVPLLSEPYPTTRRRSHTTIGMHLATPSGDDIRCRYPSKLCRNTRVRKASGALHRYCAYHRDKANANQKRWVDRQREAAVSPTASSSSVSSPTTPSSVPYPATKYRWIMAATAKPASEESAPKAKESDEKGTPSVGAEDLSDGEWDALLSLLEPSPPGRPASRCDQPTASRRRAASSPMLPTFAAKGAY